MDAKVTRPDGSTITVSGTPSEVAELIGITASAPKRGRPKLPSYVGIGESKRKRKPMSAETKAKMSAVKKAYWAAKKAGGAKPAKKKKSARK